MSISQNRPAPAVAPSVELDHDEIRRYGRHLTLPEVGLEGQKKLKAARVLLVGAGGLGSPLGLYLAAAGVGHLGLIDDDVVDLSNLQRQVLYGESDLGRLKVEAAAARLADINPHIDLRAYRQRLTAANVLATIADYDVVVDGSDNFPTRYLINDACAIAGKPNVWGAILRFEGQVAVFWSEHGPCYRCLFPEPPPPGLVPSCAEGGVFGVLPGIVGSLQANEVIKLILGIGKPLLGRFLTFDALALEFREIRLPKSPTCPICSVEPAARRLIETAAPLCEPQQPASLPQERPMAADSATPSILPLEIDVSELKTWLDDGHDVQIIDVREPQEYDICHLEGSRLVPMRQIPQFVDQIDNRPTVLHCHHGGRSQQAVMYLRQKGFTQVTNLEGGIDAWSLEIDPSVPRY